MCGLRIRRGLRRTRILVEVRGRFASLQRTADRTTIIVVVMVVVVVVIAKYMPEVEPIGAGYVKRDRVISILPAQRS